MAGRQLSAEELMKSFGGPTELPQRGGAKDYAPDGSWLQDKTLQFFYKERTQVLIEERIKKKSSLVCTEWMPDLGKVKVTGNVGKFWQTSGHMDQGRYMLYPEEALSLVDKGEIEVYFGGIALSLQECYPTLLGDRVPVEHYQVYNHLSRLGFAVFRHQPMEKMTTYERKLGLDKKISRESKSEKKNKRKATKEKEQAAKIARTEDEIQTNSSIPVDSGEQAEKIASTEDEMQTSSSIPVDTGDVSLESVEAVEDEVLNSGSDQEFVCHMDVDDDRSVVCDRVPDQNSEIVSDEGHSLEETTCIITRPCRHFNNEPIYSEPLSWLSHSDFSTINFPHLLPGAICQLDRPNPDFLPSGISLEKDSYILEAPRYTAAPRINKDNHLEFSHPSDVHRSNITAHNWTEYKKQLHGKTDKDLLLESPVGHLWSDDVQPLIKPSQALSTVSLLDRMRIIQTVNFADDIDCFPQTTPASDLQITYDVYKPDTNFSKTRPGPPAYRLSIVRQDDRCLGLDDLVHMSRLSCDGVPVQWAVVDNGDISFYTFNGVNLPVDITLK